MEVILVYLKQHVFKLVACFSICQIVPLPSFDSFIIVDVCLSGILPNMLGHT